MALKKNCPESIRPIRCTRNPGSSRPTSLERIEELPATAYWGERYLQ